MTAAGDITTRGLPVHKSPHSSKQSTPEPHTPEPSDDHIINIRCTPELGPELTADLIRWVKDLVRKDHVKRALGLSGTVNVRAQNECRLNTELHNLDFLLTQTNQGPCQRASCLGMFLVGPPIVGELSERATGTTLFSGNLYPI